MLIDTHSHLYWDSFKDDFEEVIDRALEAGVTGAINIGVDVKTSKIAAKLNSDKIKFYSSIGIHPHESLRYTQGKLVNDVSIRKDIEKLGSVYQENVSYPTKIVAVGECGLDFLFIPEYMKTPDGTALSSDQLKDLQKKLFRAQIDLAKELNLPLLVHCRDNRSENPENSACWDLILEMVGNHPAILHCYSGLMSITQKILPSPNLLVSFSATITYPKNDYLIESLKLLPLEKIVLETDCPFLPPQSKRGQRNEPSFILETAQKIAEIKGISLEEVSLQTSENTKRFLRLQ